MKKNFFEKFTSSIVFAHLQCKLVHRYPVSHNAQNRHFTQYISDNFCFLLSIYNKFQLINSKFYASNLFVYLSEFVSKRKNHWQYNVDNAAQFSHNDQIY